MGLFLLRHRAAVADGEGVLLAVCAFYAPVLELDVDGALGRAARGERAGFEGGLTTAGLAVSTNEVAAIRLIVFYQPIKPGVLLFLFGQADGAAGHMQAFVKIYSHDFFTVG